MRDPNESWFGATILGRGGVIAHPKSEGDLVAIMRDPERFPSPLRPIGSAHSMTPCIAASTPEGVSRWGTLVDMSEMTKLRNDQTMRIESRDGSTLVTVPAGRTFIEVAKELRELANLQLRVNTELGTLTIGAGACGATKDSSFPDEPGQVCSDVVAMRLVLPNGEVKDFDESDPNFTALRCSYGLFGIATEVTFKAFPHQFISLVHEKLRPAEFPEHSARWLRDGKAVFLYLFPYRNQMVAELRSRPCRDEEHEHGRVRLKARNFFWEKGLHALQEAAGNSRHLQDLFDKILAEALVSVFKLCRISPVEQIVDFDVDDPKHKFTFSMWAFPEQTFAPILLEYFALCDRHKLTFRSGLPHVGYHISGDQSSMLSYSFDGPVWTLDPICPGHENIAQKAGWEAFLRDYNALCGSHGGVPLFNQTPLLDRALVRNAFRRRLEEYEQVRRGFDPTNRMLNGYFAELLGD